MCNRKSAVCFVRGTHSTHLMYRSRVSGKLGTGNWRKEIDVSEFPIIYLNSLQCDGTQVMLISRDDGSSEESARKWKEDMARLVDELSIY